MRFCPPDHNAREAFHQGRSADIYHFLGAHPVRNGEEDAWHFAVWAPNARSVAVTGEFCAWRTDAFPMEKHYDGIWETRLPASLFAPGRPGFDYPDAAEKLTTYKYAVTGPDGCTHLKADPYGVRAELRPSGAATPPRPRRPLLSSAIPRVRSPLPSRAWIRRSCPWKRSSARLCGPW